MTDNENGTYTVTLFGAGVARGYTVPGTLVRGLDGAALSGDYVNDPASPKNGFMEIWPNVLERALAMWNDDPVNTEFDGQGDDQKGYGAPNGLDSYASPAVIWTALTGQEPDIPDLGALGMSLADYVFVQDEILGEQVLITTRTDLPEEFRSRIRSNHVYVVSLDFGSNPRTFTLFDVVDPTARLQLTDGELEAVTRALTLTQ